MTNWMPCCVCGAPGPHADVLQLEDEDGGELVIVRCESCARVAREEEQQQERKTPVCQTCKQPAKRLLLIKGIGHWFCEGHYDETVVQRAEYAVSLRELHWNE